MCFVLINPAGNRPACAGDDTSCVAVFPFAVISREDQSFIGRGMARMMCTRVGQGHGIVVICLDRPMGRFRLPMDRTLMDAVSASPELKGSDFLLTGNVIIAGGGVSTDARLVEVSTAKAALQIHETGTGLVDVVRQASVIAEAVEDFLGR